jgi:ATP-dependent DNA helicase RecG
MILEYLRKFGKTKRNNIDNLIIPKLSAVLNENQKKKKVTNFLSALKSEGKIVCYPGYLWDII